MASFQTATISSTPEAHVSLISGPQPSRQLDLQVWTSVTAPVSSDRPRWRPTLIAFPGLRHALSLRLYEAAEDVAVEDPQTGVFGAGHDLDAAIRDFQAALQNRCTVRRRRAGSALSTSWKSSGAISAPPDDD